MTCELHYKILFHDKTSIKLSKRRKSSATKTLIKPVPRKKPFHHSKILTGKKNAGLLIGKYAIEVLIFEAVNAFSSV